MEKRFLILLMLIALPVLSFSVTLTEIDSIPGFRYLYKGEAFPYDSGVAISDVRYREIVKKQQLVVIENRIQAAIPEIRERVVYIELPPPTVKNRNRKRNIAFLTGLVVGGLITEGVRLFIIK